MKKPKPVSTPADPPILPSAESVNVTHPKKKHGNASKYFLQDSFIKALQSTGTIMAACEQTGIARQTVYGWLKDPYFNAKYAEANKHIDEMLETVGIHRAVRGVERKVYYKGQPVMLPVKGPDGEPKKDDHGNVILVPASYREYSDDLLKVMLAARMPKRYRDRQDIKIDVRIVAELTSEVLSVIRRKIPDSCPHCHANLQILPALAEEMARVSEKFKTSSGS